MRESEMEMHQHSRRIQRCICGFFPFSLILLVTAGFVDCKTGNDISDERGRPLSLQAAELPGFNSRTLPAGEYAFGEEKEWRKFWQEWHSGSVPKIDFERYTLVIVSLGQKPNPGYSVEVIGAIEYKSEVVVRIVEHFPSLGRMYAQVIVYPYDVALIPVAGKQITFESSRATGDPERIR